MSNVMQGSDSLAVNEEDTICIAKLFRRKDPDDWEEVYVGVCSVMEQTNGEWCILLCGIEDNEGEVMVLPIDKTTRYEALNDVLLLWKEVLCCYSLSFLERSYRDYLLEGIHNAQMEMSKLLPSSSISEGEALALPPVSVETLSEIYRTITTAEISQKEAFHTLLATSDFKYLKELLNLFPLLESTNNLDGILNLYNLFRLIMELGYDDAVGVLFSEECYENYFGLMECDKPELPQKADFREYFKKNVHFKNTMNGLSSSLLLLIHKLYRLIYYRDAIDPQPIDDIIPSALSSQINDVISQLLKLVCTDGQFVSELIDGLETESCSMSVSVLNELFVYCKDLPSGDKESLIRSLEQKNNLFTTHLEKQLAAKHTHSERCSLFSCLEYRISFSLDSYRQYAVNQSAPSLTILCESLCDGDNYDIQLTCNSILHQLLSSDPLDSLQNSRLYDQFVRLFYEKYATLLLPPITNALPSASLVLSLLSDYEKDHGTNVQFLLLKHNLFPAILHLLDTTNRNLHLACIQFMSRCLGSSLSWYRRFIIKRNYLEPLLVYGNEHRHEDSLVMSAFLHLIQLCFLVPGTELAEYTRNKLNNFPELQASSIISDMMNIRRPNDEQINSKIPHLSSN